MNRKLIIKAVAYGALAVGLLVFGVLFSMEFKNRAEHSANEGAVYQPDGDGVKAVRLPPKQENQFITYLALTLGCGLGLGLLLAKDLSNFFAQQSVDYLFNDDGEGQRDPDYEAAETEFNNGNYLEAVRAMRNHYQKNPRLVYIALRIAEIYENNLNNPLAAALEYEEVLNKKLPPDRWGWAAIHLANLYTGKLDRADDALKLLHRIVREVPQTPAAKKARERLGMPEDATGAALPAGFRARSDADRPDHSAPASEGMAPAGEGVVESAEEANESTEAPPAALPAGFRPKTAQAGNHQAPASDSAEAVERPSRPAPESATPAPKLPPGFRPKDT